MGGITHLLLLLWAGVTVSTAVNLHKRIVHGHDCGPAERPFHVKILDGNGDFACGGSLISNKWILTAAHCWQWAMKVVLGVHPGPGRTVRITAPPVIFLDQNNGYHDIMLLKLPYRTQIQPVGLPNCAAAPNLGATVLVAGYGATTVGQQHARESGEANVLQCAGVPLIDCQVLRNTVQQNNPAVFQFLSHQHVLCANTQTADISPGDSGGGVLFNNMIYGIINFSGDAQHANTAGAGFLDVCHYLPWITNALTIL